MLTPGEKLAHYSIVERIGAGGMGEVYRARDERLNRDVAIKVLPQAFASDPSRMARFAREAQVLASLNHPQIAAVYGLEEAGTSRALVMELVEGPTLAARISEGPLPLEDALGIARQICEALEYAHEHGIVHRDLKPANIKLTPEGKVKVLDFGLAKALEGERTPEDLSASPTLTLGATQAGIILGTAAYMSPEQAKGKAADRRADVWSFGVVLYEMLSGKLLFSGETASETLASVMKDEPDWTRLPAGLPAPVDKLLRRCLTRDPRQRLQAIGEARIAIEQYLANPATAAAAAPADAKQAQVQSQRQRLIPWTVAALTVLVAAASLWGWLRPRPTIPPPVQRFVVELPKGQMIGGPVASLAASPDGSSFVYVASRLNGAGWQLHLRLLHEFQSQPLGVEEGAHAFYSPDGQWVGFFAGGKLKKISLRGGTPVVLAEVSRPLGATWSPDGRIIYCPEAGAGLWQVPDTGGTPQRLTQPDTARGERNHYWPEILPGGRAVLFAITKASSTPEQGQVAVLSLDTGKWRTLVEGGVMPKYLSSGHLIFARGGTLMAAPFDLDLLEMTSAPVPVLEDVFSETTSGQTFYSLSADGMLVYMPASASRGENQLLWVSRKGAEQVLAAPARPFMTPRLSPDGNQVALRMAETNIDVWVYDIARGSLPRLTFQEGEDESPVWTPDGKRVAYSSSLDGKPRTLFWKNADGSGVEEVLLEGGLHTHVTSVSRDGLFLAYTDYDPASKGDILVLPLKDRKPQTFLKTSFNEFDAKFSPDGRWLAYTSDESGKNEIYVQAFPGPGGKAQVSNEGGDSPVWSPDGKWLFYRAGTKMMAASVTMRPSFAASAPRTLFEGNYLDNPRREANYDVSPDGQRFLMMKGDVSGSGTTQYHVVLNWAEEVKRRAPAPK